MIIFGLENIPIRTLLNLYMFRVGLQVLNSLVLTESSGLFSDLDYSWIAPSSPTASRGRESAETRYLTTHSEGSWYKPRMPTIPNVVFCGFPRRKGNAGIVFPQT